MAFEGLSSRLQEITRKIRGKARITESDLKEMLREVKLALLEADVNYKIVKEFISTIQEKALGQDVMKSLTLDFTFVYSLSGTVSIYGRMQPAVGHQWYMDQCQYPAQ